MYFVYSCHETVSMFEVLAPLSINLHGMHIYTAVVTIYLVAFLSSNRALLDIENYVKFVCDKDGSLHKNSGHLFKYVKTH